MVDIAPPVAKKLRTETDDLIPEQEFIAKNPVSKSVTVSCTEPCDWHVGIWNSHVHFEFFFLGGVGVC